MNNIIRCPNQCFLSSPGDAAAPHDARADDAALPARPLPAPREAGGRGGVRHHGGGAGWGHERRELAQPAQPRWDLKGKY